MPLPLHFNTWTLTVRHGSQVRRERYSSVQDAVSALRREAEAIRAEGPLGKVSALRDYAADQRVHARLEISTGGFLRGRDAGVDVMGDGALVPYRGGVRRKRLDCDDGQSPFQAVGEALAAG